MCIYIYIIYINIKTEARPAQLSIRPWNRPQLSHETKTTPKSGQNMPKQPKNSTRGWLLLIKWWTAWCSLLLGGTDRFRIPLNGGTKKKTWSHTQKDQSHKKRHIDFLQQLPLQSNTWVEKSQRTQPFHLVGLPWITRCRKYKYSKHGNFIT